MTVIVRIEPTRWISLRRHLLQSTVEQVAFAFCEYSIANGGAIFDVVEIDHVAPADFDLQTEVHVSIRDEALAKLIKKAWDNKRSVVEFHSHPNFPNGAAFSPSDLRGLEEHVPYLFWRLRGRPYGAVVVGPKAFDGLAWLQNADDLRAIDQLNIDGEAMVATGETLRGLRAHGTL